jgi:hypothetical protein
VERGKGIRKEKEVDSQTSLFSAGRLYLLEEVYFHQNKKKAEAESKNCHAKTMLSLEKSIKLI